MEAETTGIHEGDDPPGTTHASQASRSQPMKTIIKKLCRAARELCFPPVCLICGTGLPTDPTILFCPACAGRITLLYEPLCHRCGKPFFAAAGNNHFCSTCLTSDSWQFTSARGVVCYSGPIKSVLHAFKYHGQTAALSSFAALRQNLPHLHGLESTDYIAPVPLHRSRLRQRGFNQSLLLARAFFPDAKDRINPLLLERWRRTPSQTGLSGAARRKNIRGAFRVPRPEMVRGQSILLVDDVYTTGATVNECAMVLRRAGAREVRVLTLARVEE